MLKIFIFHCVTHLKGLVRVRTETIRRDNYLDWFSLVNNWQLYSITVMENFSVTIATWVCNSVEGLSLLELKEKQVTN